MDQEAAISPGRPVPLFTQSQIADRIAQLGQQISKDYAHADELVLIGVLRGAFFFTADLARSLTIPCSVELIAATSYGATTSSSGRVRLDLGLTVDISEKHVLIIEDIIDTGITLASLLAMLQERRPASLRTCVLLNKLKNRKRNVPADYIGFETDDLWIAGYGLDFKGWFRALPYLGVVPKAASTSLTD